MAGFWNCWIVWACRIIPPDRLPKLWLVHSRSPASASHDPFFERCVLVRSLKTYAVIGFGLAAIIAAAIARPFPPRPKLVVLIAVDQFRYDYRSEEHTSELQSPCNLVC